MKFVPLVIDLDGTLLRSDLLAESGLSYIRTNPFRFLMPLKWLFSGKAHLKANLAHSISLDVSHLPYDQEIIHFIKNEKAKGRHIILATASHKIYADQVAEHLGLFDRVLATEGEINFSASQKRDYLVKEFGEKGFDYMGNSHADIAVWKSAREAYLVNPNFGVESKVKSLNNIKEIIYTRENRFSSWVKAFRFHQWVKNILIFIPLLASHQMTDLHLFKEAVVAYLLFGLCASSVYLLNDLLDLPDDRHHLTKRFRPFASGQLSPQTGLLVSILLLLFSFTGSLMLLPWPFAITLGTYYLLTAAYSFYIKKIMTLDVITLAALYTLRIVAGAFAIQLLPTFWILAFSMFIFLSLALVKRYAELREAKDKGQLKKVRGRGYYPNDLEMISSLGAASGYIAVLVLALYIQDQSTIDLYRYPAMMWLACPLLLFWISRTWLLTHRGEMHDDPVVFAVKDKISLFIGILFAVIFWVAT